jgi:SAM-dependent methyltransferase
VFSNVVYWLDDPVRALSEIGRVLTPDGLACVLLPNTTLRDFSFYWSLHKRNGDPAFAFLDLLDRGRLTENVRQVKSSKEWMSIIEKAGLRILDHQQYLSRPIVQIWDIGLRPLFPALSKMAACVPADKRTEVKDAWIGSLEPLLRPLVEMDGTLDTSAEPAFHRYVLGK